MQAATSAVVASGAMPTAPKSVVGSNVGPPQALASALVSFASKPFPGCVSRASCLVQVLAAFGGHFGSVGLICRQGSTRVVSLTASGRLPCQLDVGS
mgnify:CR=1 FL=1